MRLLYIGLNMERRGERACNIGSLTYFMLMLLALLISSCCRLLLRIRLRLQRFRFLGVVGMNMNMKIEMIAEVQSQFMEMRALPKKNTEQARCNNKQGGSGSESVCSSLYQGKILFACDRCALSQVSGWIKIK